jgi:hypothetical protein
MAAIVGAIATLVGLILLFVRRMTRAGEPGTAEEQPIEQRH